MVEKIDKPEVVSAYHIQATTETKRDRGGSGQETPSHSDEYSGSHAAPGWQKIYAAASNRRYLKLRREDVVRAWFKGVFMQKGISLAEVDIQTQNGKLLSNVHIILVNREDFWTLKKFQLGQDVPLNMILKEPIIEISIPMAPVQQAPRASLEKTQVVGTQETPKKKFEINKIDIKMILTYAGIGAVVLLMIILIMMMIR